MTHHATACCTEYTSGPLLTALVALLAFVQHVNVAPTAKNSATSSAALASASAAVLDSADDIKWPL